MLSVVKAQGATVDNKALPLWCQTTATPVSVNPGKLQDVSAASFQILNGSGTQIFPATAGNKQALDLVAHKVGVGYYVAVWDSSSASVGTYTIRWYVTPIAAGSEERVFEQDFEVVTAPYRGRNYTSIQALRDEGVPSARLSDSAAQKLILTASKYVEMYTGRVFCPVSKVLRLDGTNSRALLLDEPIVAIKELSVSFVSQFASGDVQVLEDSYRVYNRHLTLDMLDPDDRECPKLEFLHDDDLLGLNTFVPNIGRRLTQLIWPKGQQNCRIEGVFGYTEPDGSWCGQTPELIQIATKLLCFRYMSRPGSNQRDDAVKRPRIGAEHTKDQGYSLSPNPAFDGYTGDAEIDGILSGFTRPPKFGAP